MMFGFVLAIFGAAWLNNHQMDKRFDEMNRRLEEMGKRFEAQLESVKSELRGQIESVKSELRGQIESVKSELRGQDRHNQARFSAIEEDIREIKNDLKRFFLPVLPK